MNSSLPISVFRKGPESSSVFVSKGPVIIYRLGGGNLWGITGFLGEQKGGSVVTENPKGGSLKTLEGFSRGTTQICLENEGNGRGRGIRKSSNVFRGDYFSEVTFEGRIG